MKKKQSQALNLPGQSLLTVSQAAKYLNCHPNSLRRWEKQGLINPVRLGPKGHRRYRLDELSRLVKVKDDQPDEKEKPADLSEREAYYRKLLDQMEVEQNKLVASIELLPIGVGMGDKDGTTLSLNRAGLEIHGFKTEAEMFRRLNRYADEFELRYPDGRLMPLADWPASRAMRGDYVRDFELRLVNKLEGIERYLSYSVVPVRDSKGQISLFAYVMQDLTNYKKTEEGLRESETRFRQLAESMPQLVWTAKADGEVDYYNEKYHEFEGIVRTGDKYEWAPVLHQEDIKKTVKAWEKAVETGEMYQVEHRVKTKHNGYRWFLSRGVPVRDRKGDIEKWYGTATDINDQKLAEGALKKSEARFRRLFESNVVGIMFWGIDGLISGANDIFLETVGYSRDDLKKGKINWIEMSPPEYKELDQQTLEELIRTGHQSPTEKEYIRKDGSRVSIMVGSTFIDDDKTQGIGFVLDITQQKLLEQQKDMFLSVASHELKTPVTSLKAYIHVLNKFCSQKGDERQKRILGKMDGQIDKLTLLISDLLDVTKIEAGGLKLRRRRFNMNKLINEVVEQIQLTTDRHRIVTEFGKAVQVSGDRDRIGQVLINFLTNAIKYSPSSDKIAVGSRELGGEVQVHVTDFGLGIPKKNQRNIFSRFYRVDGKSNETFPGLGLGLFISAEIIKRHQGKIWLKSQENQGSTFYFSLPISTSRSR